MQALTNLRIKLIAACKDETLPKPRRKTALECLDELDLGLAQIANQNYTPDGLDIIDLAPQMTADEQRKIHLFVKMQNKWYVPTFYNKVTPSSIVPNVSSGTLDCDDFEDVF